MTIEMLVPLSAGNAVEILLAPPRAAARWRLLRKPVDSFAGPDDPAATVVADDCAEAAITDILGLLNGTQYFYQVHYRDAAGAWLPPPGTKGIVPAARYRGDDLDVQSLVRDRLDLGLAVEVGAGRLKAPAETGRIAVTLAPFALSDTIRFPTVSVHLDHDASAERALGEAIMPDERQAGGGWRETEGWLSRVALNIAGVSLNPNERLALRRAIRRVIQANLPVFDGMGLLLCDFQQRDHEDADSFNAPLYFTLGTFTCLAPAYVAEDVDALEDVVVKALDYPAE